MKEPAITTIELTPLHVPFHQLVLDAMRSGRGGLGMAIPAEGEWSGGDFVIARLTAEDGSEGLGEAFVWLPETGVSPEEILIQVEHALGRCVLGSSPFESGAIRARMDRSVARCEVAKGLLDMACYDLMGRICGRQACAFMGGRGAEEFSNTALIPLIDIGTMMGLCAHFHGEGYRSFRLKLGSGVREDEAIVQAFRERFGEGVRLRVDYNQAYAPAEAVRAIGAIEDLGVDCAEQPVRSGDWAGMAFVQQRVSVPLMAHEGCFSLDEFCALAAMGAVGVLGINSERPGGVTHALRAIDHASSLGMGTVLHNQPLGIASAMQLHLAAARYFALGYPLELFGHVMLEDDLILEPIDYSNGKARLPGGPGWGVALDQEALGRYRTAKGLVLKV